MNLKQAIKILKEHNVWRRYNGDGDGPKMTNPKELGIAIDVVVKEFETKKVNRGELIDTARTFLSGDNFVICREDIPEMVDALTKKIK